MKKGIYVVATAIAVIIGLAFQNCSNVSFNSDPTLDNTVGPEGTNGNNNNNNNNNDTGKDPSISDSLKTVKPVFAARAMNCINCHGVVGSSIVTDFGYGSPNFSNNKPFIPNDNYNGATRTAYNNVDGSDSIGGWQSFTVLGGSVHVPKTPVPASISNIAFGNNADTTFATVMQWLNIRNAGGKSMVDGVTPAAGQPKIIEDTSIKISYPSASEILSLLPAALQGNALAVSAIQVAGHQASQVSGFSADASGGFMRNSSDVTCYGDVVVKGPLFLKNLRLTTDKNGCRLYVSETVFIQGPIKYLGATGSNLQITSASAIMMGLSAQRMGAATSGTEVRRKDVSDLTTAGGPWARLMTSLDDQYNPSGMPINGVASKTFFDNIVINAKSIGAELLDAGDTSYVNNPMAPDETVVTEPNTSENFNVGGKRISIDYSGLLLNAPHIHSRYAGNFKGVIICDVAMLARNPSTSKIEQFVYDPVFDDIPADNFLPALKTEIFSVQH
jgi:hypothetical protein